MRELKLRYFIELASNIGAKARADAQTVERSQRAMQSAVDKTGGAVRGLDTAYARWGASNAAERQLGYMRRLAQGIEQTTAKARSLATMLNTALPKAVAIGGGATGAFFAAKTLLDKPMDYDMRLRGVTSTAFAGKDLGALRAGKNEINQLVIDTVGQAKGASRDATLTAFEKLVGSGSFSLDESKALLPKIMKTSVASVSDANDLVQAAEKMKVNFGLTPDQIEVALAKLMRGGQEGGFEIKDSASWIGRLAPFFKGYKGMAGVEAMVTMLQQVRSTAGTNDEAANNLRNFVQKMGSDNTTKDFKKQGINLTAEMARGAARGETPVDTYMAQLDKVMAKQDPEGKARAAMKKVDGDKSLSPEDRKERYAQVAEIYKTAGISKIINDLQEMGGYSGLAGTKAYGKKVLAAVQSEDGNAVKTGYEFMIEGAGSKAQQLANNRDIAMSQAMGEGGPLKKLLDGANWAAEKFPVLTATVVGTTAALGVFATALMAFGILARPNVGGPVPRGGPGGGPPRVPGSPGAYPTLDGAKPAAGSGGGWKASGLRGLSIAGNLAYLGYELFGTSDADIATLNAADARKDNAAKNAALPMNWRGNGFNDPRLLTLTAPGAAEQTLTAGQPTKIELGEGKLGIDVRVTDERTTARATVTAPMSGVKISAGATNPQGSW